MSGTDPTLPESDAEGDTPPRGASVGRFLILGVLGKGGMGVVLSAYDPDLDRKVALKLLHGAPGHTRLAAEAQALARLAHPNVVAVHEIGSHAAGPFVVMEQVDGVTLRAWLKDRPRPWREVLALLRGAGAGLAAAHQAGLVHRDFKPENVLVGSDGRPRVVDFGLAESTGDPRDGETAPAGTVPYMAPEQLRGEPLDARADQFAFALVCWEALFGERPFTALSLAELLVAMAAGPNPPPRERKVPERIRLALVRGLAVDPAARWSSLDELLAALADDRAARRARLAAWAVAVGVVAAAGVAFAVGRTQSAHGVCDGGDALAAEVWNDAARARVAAAFQATGRPYADDTFRRVDASLGARLEAWARAHRDACEATRVRHQQSETLFDRRMQCLERARRDARTLVALLGEADGAALDKATGAAAAAADVGACADLGALMAAVPPPRDPALAREVESLRAESARVRSLDTLGRHEEALAAARALLPRVRAAGYAPLLAEALDPIVTVELDAGNLPYSVELAHEMIRAAEEAHDDALRAQALVQLGYVVGRKQQRYPEGELIFRMAEAAAARAGNPAKLVARMFEQEGQLQEAKEDHRQALGRYLLAWGLDTLAYGMDDSNTARALGSIADEQRTLGDHVQALATHQQALAIMERVLGPDNPEVTGVISNLGIHQEEAGDYAAAEKSFLRALAGYEKVYGPSSTQVAMVLNNLAIVRYYQGRLAEARELGERALAIREQSLGRDHPHVASTLHLLAELAERQDRLEDAQAILERELAIRTASPGPTRLRLAETYHALGTVAMGRGRLAEARTHYQQALEIRQEAQDPDVGDELRGLAKVTMLEHRFGEAIPLLERALAAQEKVYGPKHMFVVLTLIAYGEALLEAGRVADALAVAERAVAAAADMDREIRAEATMNLAEALWATGKDRPRALALARQARAVFATLDQKEDLAGADRWLAERAR